MKKSQLLQIIKEEVSKVLNEGAYEDAMANLNAKVGIKPTLSKNTFKSLKMKWPTMSSEDRVNVLMAVCKDPDDAENLALVNKWDELPDYVTANLKEVVRVGKTLYSNKR